MANRYRRAAGRLGGWNPSQSPRPSVGQEGAGVLLALFAYPVLVNLLTGGPGQAWGWVQAKWINKPYGSASSAAPAPVADPGTGTYSVSYNTPAPPAPARTVIL